jgi:hypothetical protein
MTPHDSLSAIGYPAVDTAQRLTVRLLLDRSHFTLSRGIVTMIRSGGLTCPSRSSFMDSHRYNERTSGQ